MRNMNICKRIISCILLGTMLIQLTGCKSQMARDLKSMIDAQEVIEVDAIPATTYDVNVQGKLLPFEPHIYTDQLKTHNDGFRQSFNKIFNLTLINDANEGNGLQGCLYVVNRDGEEYRSGATTLADAFRNKAFIEKYWSGNNSSALLNEVNKIAMAEYSDLTLGDSFNIYAAFSAYYNLLPEYTEPNSFNGNVPLTREQFYSLLYRCYNSPTEIVYDRSLDIFANAVGKGQEDTVDTKYAREVAEYGWLTIDNGCLNSKTIDGYITRAEAIYMIVKMSFPDLYQQVSDGSESYNDCKSNGDLAAKLEFKDKKSLIELPMWQAYVLKYMINNPDKGMQSELYRAMAVAKSLNLINDTKSRWNERLSRGEALELIINSLVSLNRQQGYLTKTEYADIVAVEPDKHQIPERIMTKINRLTEEQIKIFVKVSKLYLNEFKQRQISQLELDKMQLNALSDVQVTEGIIVKMIADAYPYWKYLNGYTDIFPTWVDEMDSNNQVNLIEDTEDIEDIGDINNIQTNDDNAID